MSMTEELRRAEKRLAAMVDARADEAEASARADRAERAMTERERAREDAERRREIGAQYAPAFDGFGTLTPPPLENERPGAYRKRLYEHLRHRLPSTHELSALRADDIPAGPAVRNFEQMLIDAAVAEGSAPSFENLPRDGSMISRTRTDPDSGQKRTEYYGRRSFIHDFSMQPLKVHRIINPRTREILFGPAFPTAPAR